jgi:hypothetical protein
MKKSSSGDKKATQVDMGSMTGMTKEQKGRRYIEEIPKNFNKLHNAKRQSDKEAEKEIIL